SPPASPLLEIEAPFHDTTRLFPTCTETAVAAVQPEDVFALVVVLLSGGNALSPVVRTVGLPTKPHRADGLEFEVGEERPLVGSARVPKLRKSGGFPRQSFCRDQQWQRLSSPLSGDR